MEITVLKAVRAELSGLLPGSRVAALDGGEGGVLSLTLKGEGARRTLLISPRPPIFFVRQIPPRYATIPPVLLPSITGRGAGGEGRNLARGWGLLGVSL